MPSLEYYDPVYEQLQAELYLQDSEGKPVHEQLLINLLQLPRGASPEEKLGEIAVYVDVILDGTYTPEDVERLCHTLLKKLKQKRGEFVLELIAPNVVQ